MPIKHITELFALDGSAFITAAYRNLLNREPDEAGLAYYLGRLSMGYGKARVIAQLAQSPECRPHDEVKGLKKLIAAERRAGHWFWDYFSRRSRVEKTLHSGLAGLARIDQRLESLQDATLTQTQQIGSLAQQISALRTVTLAQSKSEEQQLPAETVRQFFREISWREPENDQVIHDHSRQGSPDASREIILNIEGVTNIKKVNSSFTQEEYNLISNSSLFDADYYLKSHPEVAKAGIDPLSHFMEYGWKEKKNPSPEFDVCFYLVMNKDVRDAGINPLLHYCGNGKIEGRLINSSQVNCHHTESFSKNYHDITKAKEKEKTFYKNYETKEAIRLDIKAIAFYLPQYHPILENDSNWGKGFTEWTNVTKANQNFVGHYQPQLPIDLGFYDLRIVDNIKRQAELAKNYGIYGFCFHHYWFDGKGVMRTPIDLLLEHKEIEINFCINWANENWTRRWDGRDKDILLKQNHSDEDDILFIQDASKYFRDSRYIRINNKPLLLIYRPSLFPNIKKTVSLWRKWCIQNDIGDLYICLTDSFEDINPESINFDASIQFVPNTLPLESIEHSLQITNPDFTGGIVSYDDAVEVIKNFKKPEFKKFRGICPAWDNTPRRQDSAYIVHDSTPEKYKNWLKIIIEDTFETFPEEERFIFINAWNEWAEGAHLEPDRRYGYAYLDATYAMLNELEKEKLEAIKVINNNFKKISKHFLVIHAYYFDVWDEFEHYIATKKGEFDFFISVSSDITIDNINKLANHNCIIRIVANVSRDLAPFFDFYNLLTEYDFGCKISFKKSSTEIIGDIWREQVFSELLSDPSINSVNDLFKDESIGMIIPESFLLDFKCNISSNKNEIINLCNDFNIPFPQSATSFSAGTMFWFRPKAMQQLEDFKIKSQYEPLKQDGTPLHAMERILGYLCETNGYTIRSIKKNGHEGSKKSYFENILEKGNIASYSNNRIRKGNKSNLLIFVHYNKISNKIDKYVFKYLKNLQELDVDIVFVTNSYIDESHKTCLLEIVTKVVLRENVGYDFSAYKHGLSVSDFWNYEKVFLVNDTIYGPFDDFSKHCKAILNHQSDLVGLTSSMQFGLHIQSYFICFDKKVARTDSFREFWSLVKDETCVEDVIMNYEIKLTSFFSNKGYSANALFELEENVMMKNPISLLEQGFPFIKKRFIESMSDFERHKLLYYLQNKFGSETLEEILNSPKIRNSPCTAWLTVDA
jgi:lipopolysaccharide biosynthesis protein